MGTKATNEQWSFFTNHTNVLICLYEQSDVRLREVAERIGITERAVQKIVSDLDSYGYIERSKQGRRNRYRLNLTAKLKNPLFQGSTIGDLLAASKENFRENLVAKQS